MSHSRIAERFWDGRLIAAGTVIAAVATSVGASPPWPANETHSKAQSSIELCLRGSQVPGATAALVASDGTTIELATGFADRLGRVRMKPDSLMLSGSIGKTFVSATVLQLVAERRLGLDDKLAAYLGERPWFARLPNGRDITLRSLLNHTSGLIDHGDDSEFEAVLRRDPGRRWAHEELVQFLLDKAPLGPVGEIYRYSDTNYILLGLVIEKITRATFYAEATRRFLRPLKLDRTAPSDKAVLPGLVSGYVNADNIYGLPADVSSNGRDVLNPQVEWTGGGFITNSRDLAKWAQALYGGSAIGATQREMMFSNTAKGKADPKYGLGVYEWPTDLGTAYGHQGDFPGYWSVMLYFPRQRMAVAMQFNTDDEKAFAIPPLQCAINLASAVLGKKVAVSLGRS